MKTFIAVVSALIVSSVMASDDIQAGKKVFETYCWGCHHQTSVAFGPSFEQIAAKRTHDEIEAYVVNPEGMYEQFGYKRTVMPILGLDERERKLVADYILSYKAK